MTSQAILVRTLSDQLVERLRDRILSGIAQPGLPIRQDALAAELGVSKIPVREALARLEQEGLIRSHANRGYFVRSLTTAEAEEVYELRLRLEPEAVALAAARADDGERRLAAESLDSLDRAIGEGVGAANRAFHLALIRPCARPITTLFLERLQILSERYVRKHLEPLGRNERAHREHHELLRSWLGRDGAGVAEQTRAHIARTLVDLRGQLPAEA